MPISDEIFSAFLDCQTKSFLKFLNDGEFEDEYVNYKRKLVDDYKKRCLVKMLSRLKEGEWLADINIEQVPLNSNLQLITNIRVQTGKLQSQIHAIECITAPTDSKHFHHIPIRFVPSEKITEHDKLRIAFDALVLSSNFGKMPQFGKIIYGSKQKTVKIKLAGLLEKVQKLITRITAQQAKAALPQLVLKKHCAECEFQSKCRREAVEKDDLSLLSGLGEKERAALQSRGIFSVTQLSYTFRPRRRPKRLASKGLKTSFALKALAIRENKIHITGTSSLLIKGTSVFLDIEGIPNQDFYYLIGVRVKNGDHYTQHSLWADEAHGEKQIWQNFLRIMKSIENPQLIHYGSYETTFLKRMKKRYAQTIEASAFVEQLIEQSINILSVIYAQIYFPTYSNGLKDIARYYGFEWSDEKASGFTSLVWRDQWEYSKDRSVKEKLIVYNAEDCRALELITENIKSLCEHNPETEQPLSHNIVHADLLKREYPQRFGKINLMLPELNYINQAAYWNYQRDKIYLRSKPALKRLLRKQLSVREKSLPVNKVIQCAAPANCPKCQSKRIFKYGKMSRIIYDLKFGKAGIKRWIVRYLYNRYLCWSCRMTFISYKDTLTKNKYGSELSAYIVYQIIDLNIPQTGVAETINQFFKLPVTSGTISHQKVLAADYYKDTYQTILNRIITGNIIYADETKANVKGKDAYVWIFTNMEEVAYLYTETREGNFLREMLKDYKGVLVSDFYAAYDGIDCPQQKCLIHLMRDLNDDMFKQPFNEELREMLKKFALLLTPMIETIDRFGLKAWHLQKHKIYVDRFYKDLSRRDYQNELVVRCKRRFEKNRHTLFTFLDYDGVAWNNNNAEHAVKSFAKLRNIIGGSGTEKSIQDYVILLSICETCKYRGINFLKFLRSKETNLVNVQVAFT